MFSWRSWRTWRFEKVLCKHPHYFRNSSSYFEKALSVVAQKAGLIGEVLKIKKADRFSPVSLFDWLSK
jgi:hypothetical protein